MGKDSLALDLSFSGFDSHTEVTALPADLSVLMVGIAARQAASPTATIQARFDATADSERLLAPLSGAFNGPMAATLMRWKDE